MDWRYNMVKDMIKIINDKTGEEIEREMTAAEQKVRDKEIADYAQAKADRLAIELKNEEAKQAILDRLGLTADEAKLILG